MKQKVRTDNRIRQMTFSDFYNFFLVHYLEGKEFGWANFQFNPSSMCFISRGTTSISMLKDPKSWRPIDQYSIPCTYTPKLIIVSKRDGVTEISFLKDEIGKLENWLAKTKSKNTKKAQAKLARMKKFLKDLPPFSPLSNPSGGQKDNYFLSLEPMTTRPEMANQFVILDVETNGLGAKRDDLLSLSLLDPDSGLAYNRYFPLEKQPTVLTTDITGITEADLATATPLTQSDVDEIIQRFSLSKKKILCYGGSSIPFDQKFLGQYFNDHGLKGFKCFNFYNFKVEANALGFPFSFGLSKDHLCSFFHIDGVKSLHSSLNDCVLEWKLYEAIHNRPFLWKEDSLYLVPDDYAVPITYALDNPKIFPSRSIEWPRIIGRGSLIYQHQFPKRLLKNIAKFPTNITGISIEHLINSMIGAKEVDSRSFLCQNSAKLIPIGKIPQRNEIINVIPLKNGKFESVDPEYQDYVDNINAVNETISAGIGPFIQFLKDLFGEEKIFSQELVFSHDNKVFALCDLSSKSIVVEIKTVESAFLFEGGFRLRSRTAQQIWHQARGRATYLVSTDFEHCSRNYSRIKNLFFNLYEIRFENSDVDND